MKKVLRNFVFMLAYGCSTPVLMAADTSTLSFVNNIPFINVSIGSVETRMMIDSGGALLISIPESTVVKSKSVDLLPGKNRFRDIAGKEYQVQKLLARNVIVGSTRLEPVEGQIHVQWGGAPEGPDAPLTIARQLGALGIGAFGDRKILLDYQKRIISIYEAGESLEFGPNHWIELPMEYGKIGPNITLKLGESQVKFILDTGAQVNLVNGAKFKKDAQCSPNSGNAASCDEKRVGMLQGTEGVLLGELSAERVDLSGAPFDGILGAPFFQKYRVVFDISGKRLYIAALDQD